jgi:hypothetical protein
METTLGMIWAMSGSVGAVTSGFDDGDGTRHDLGNEWFLGGSGQRV